MLRGAAPSKGAGMPTNKQRLSINLSDREYAELSALAERNNLSMAWIGHKAVCDFLDHAHSESLQLPLTFSRHRVADELPSEKSDVSEP
jgi:hypothetical protein